MIGVGRLRSVARYHHAIHRRLLIIESEFLGLHEWQFNSDGIHHHQTKRR
ncbi:hypothetical protein Lpp48_07133 [Lacticaseibacillus paracasei subsp. paracasei Lpp48]|nr:hypothetical protein Lpp48_07133 [Lacticaseibacillus paracasei subsp. paracasei Lpp48]